MHIQQNAVGYIKNSLPTWPILQETHKYAEA